MIYEFKMYQAQVEDHVFWIAESKILNGCVAQGDTPGEAYSGLEEAEQAWLETAHELNWEIPTPTVHQLKLYSGKVALRISPIVHKEAAQAAEEQGISLNQYIGDAIIAYNHHVKNFDVEPISQVRETAKTQSSVSISLTSFFIGIEEVTNNV